MNILFNLAAENASSGPFMLIMLVAIGVIFYFFMIRPQKKQDREMAAMRNSLRVGDEITTIGGIIGKIVSIKDPTCIIETGRDGTRIRILKTAVKSVDVPAAATVAKPEDSEEKPEEKPEENGEGAKEQLPEGKESNTGKKKKKNK